MGVLSIRIGLGIVALIAAIEILQTQAVLNAILLFGAAGIVPGTDIALSPEATMWSLGGVLIAGILLIFHKDIIVACMPAAPVAPTTIAEMPEEVVMVAVSEPVAKPCQRRFAINFRWLRLPRVKLPSLPKLNVTRHAVKVARAMKVLAARLRIAWRTLEPLLAFAATQSGHALRKASQLGLRALRAAIIEIQRLDQWATAKIQKRDDLSEVQKLLRESTKVLMQWLSRARVFIAHLPRKLDR